MGEDTASTLRDLWKGNIPHSVSVCHFKPSDWPAYRKTGIGSQVKINPMKVASAHSLSPVATATPG